MIFGMRMPFPKITNGALTCLPSGEGYARMSKRHSFKQISKAPVPFRRRRCFIDQQVDSMDSPQQQSTCFAVRVAVLDVVVEDIKRR